MNANQLAERLEQHHTVFNDSAAVMLRKQHEAIKTMRTALQLNRASEVTARSHEYNKGIAKAALTATEEFK